MNPLDMISKLFRGGKVKQNAKTLARQEAQRRSNQMVNKPKP